MLKSRSGDADSFIMEFKVLDSVTVLPKAELLPSIIQICAYIVVGFLNKWYTY